MSTPIINPERLSEDINLLGNLLGKVIRRQAGVEIFRKEEDFRSLAKVRRTEEDKEVVGETTAAITHLVSQFSLDELEAVARAFTNYFQLINIAEDQHRIRVLRQASRKLDDATFRTVTGAVLERKRLSFNYRARSTGEGSVRTTSPQRLTHYRDNWYLDAFDHDKRGLRSFALDRVTAANMLAAPADDWPEADLDAHFASSYGIFSGPARAWATIRFSPHAARWVADERWHSQQKGRFLSDGRFELQLPFGNARELLMDVLRYGPDAEVIAPVSLREEMKQLLTLALTGYAAGR